jgi:hypothetical protein
MFPPPICQPFQKNTKTLNCPVCGAVLQKDVCSSLDDGYRLDETSYHCDEHGVVATHSSHTLYGSLVFLASPTGLEDVLP